jgi:predicted nucleic acid-binding Zn ribbon protein
VDPLSAAIPAVLRDLLRRAPMSPGKMEAAWRLAVGPAIDRATSIALRDNGTLEVAAAELAWRRELRRSHALILARLGELLGSESVRKIRVVARLSDSATLPSGGTEDPAT